MKRQNDQILESRNANNTLQVSLEVVAVVAFFVAFATFFGIASSVL